jgi:hypothetical protein
MGMMGQMQGIQTARRPATKPMRRSQRREWEARSEEEPKVCNSEVTGDQRAVSSEE